MFSGPKRILEIFYMVKAIYRVGKAKGLWTFTDFYPKERTIYNKWSKYLNAVESVLEGQTLETEMSVLQEFELDDLSSASEITSVSVTVI